MIDKAFWYVLGLCGALFLGTLLGATAHKVNERRLCLRDLDSKLEAQYSKGFTDGVIAQPLQEPVNLDGGVHYFFLYNYNPTDGYEINDFKVYRSDYETTH